MAEGEATGTTQCPRCFGDIHPDARACRHCGEVFDRGEHRALVSNAVWGWLATLIVGGGGWALVSLANRDQVSDGIGTAGALLVLAGVGLGIASAYYTVRAAARP
jgi:hypothetical protein